MRVVGINGSPRKGKNTATLIENVLAGFASKGAKTELVHLHDLSFSGCSSCFACKRLGSSSFGRCALNDDLTEVLESVLTADALVIGSPVYFIDVTGAVRCFEERLFFPTVLYSSTGQFAYERRIPVVLIMTMNEPSPEKDPAFTSLIELQTRFYNELIGDTKVLLSTDTMQYDDYSKYAGEIFDEQAKIKRHKSVFKDDCASAYKMGLDIAEVFCSSQCMMD